MAAYRGSTTQDLGGHYLDSTEVSESTTTGKSLTTKTIRKGFCVYSKGISGKFKLLSYDISKFFKYIYEEWAEQAAKLPSKWKVIAVIVKKPDMEENSQERRRYKPHIVALGHTGAGKSMFMNALSKANDMFPVGHEMKSKTNKCRTEVVVVSVPNANNQHEQSCTIQLTDTPGFNDSQGRDIAFKSDILSNMQASEYVHRFMLVTSFKINRWNNTLTEMISTLERQFTDGIWDHFAVVMTHLEYPAITNEKEAEAQMAKDIDKKRQEVREEICERFVAAKRYGWDKKNNIFFVNSLAMMNRMTDENFQIQFTAELDESRRAVLLQQHRAQKYSDAEVRMFLSTIMGDAMSDRVFPTIPEEKAIEMHKLINRLHESMKRKGTDMLEQLGYEDEASDEAQHNEWNKQMDDVYEKEIAGNVRQPWQRKKVMDAFEDLQKTEWTSFHSKSTTKADVHRNQKQMVDSDLKKILLSREFSPEPLVDKAKLKNRWNASVGKLGDQAKFKDLDPSFSKEKFMKMVRSYADMSWKTHEMLLDQAANLFRKMEEELTKLSFHDTEGTWEDRVKPIRDKHVCALESTERDRLQEFFKVQVKRLWKKFHDEKTESLSVMENQLAAVVAEITRVSLMDLAQAQRTKNDFEPKSSKVWKDFGFRDYLKAPFEEAKAYYLKECDAALKLADICITFPAYDGNGKIDKNKLADQWKDATNCVFAKEAVNDDRQEQFGEYFTTKQDEWHTKLSDRLRSIYKEEDNFKEKIRKETTNQKNRAIEGRKSIDIRQTPPSAVWGHVSNHIASSIISDAAKKHVELRSVLLDFLNDQKKSFIDGITLADNEVLAFDFISAVRGELEKVSVGLKLDGDEQKELQSLRGTFQTYTSSKPGNFPTNAEDTLKNTLRDVEHAFVEKRHLYKQILDALEQIKVDHVDIVSQKDNKIVVAGTVGWLSERSQSFLEQWDELARKRKDLEAKVIGGHSNDMKKLGVNAQRYESSLRGSSPPLGYQRGKTTIPVGQFTKDIDVKLALHFTHVTLDFQVSVEWPGSVEATTAKNKVQLCKEEPFYRYGPYIFVKPKEPIVILEALGHRLMLMEWHLKKEGEDDFVCSVELQISFPFTSSPHSVTTSITLTCQERSRRA